MRKNVSELSVPTYETKRLILRETELDDAKDYFEFACLDNVGPVAGWREHKSVNETKAVLNLFEGKKDTGQLGTMAVVLKENNKMIGTVELHTYTKDFKAELGYTISPYYWGKEYAVEASLKALDWGFNKLHLKRIEASTLTFNKQSYRVLEKLHFTFEGLRKKAYKMYDGKIYDIYSYALTDEEYFSLDYQKYIKELEKKYGM